MKTLKDTLEPAAPPREEKLPRAKLIALGLTALGIVYGDIGTSPLYAVRACFAGTRTVALDRPDILGVLSLIFWSLVIVISVKYLLYVMRADNRGEGGILALMALVHPGERDFGRSRRILVGLGLFGAALLYGDGTITPAISVLSAVEGLDVATTSLSSYVVPITVAILIGLFALQRRGTAGIGAIFGPVMLLWFTVLATLGVRGIMGDPSVLAALLPTHAIAFFAHAGWRGYAVLGTVFLVVTGGEALYADMGHLGKRPIRSAWFVVVLPALLLNYFGQGALLLRDPDALVNPFYRLAPGWALWPLVGLATLATVIASQAVVSGAFSLTRQAIQLGYCPRLPILHTSKEEIGQVYVPAVNGLLLIFTVALVLGFRHSTNLAAAYGMAVSTTMVITTVLAWVVARDQWHWPWGVVLVISLVFLAIDLAFLGANLLKVTQGGWFPLLIAAIIFILMTTWQQGRRSVSRRLGEGKVELDKFLDSEAVRGLPRVPGVAVFLTGTSTGTPTALRQHVRHNKVLHETVVLLTVVVRNVPHIGGENRVTIKDRGHGIFRVIGVVGYLDSPSVPEILRRCREQEMKIDPNQVSYYVGREITIPTSWHGFSLWRGRLYAFMDRNAQPITTFFQIPHHRVIEIGTEVES